MINKTPSQNKGEQVAVPNPQSADPHSLFGQTQTKIREAQTLLDETERFISALLDPLSEIKRRIREFFEKVEKLI
mgnify:CR=1 FL=1